MFMLRQESHKIIHFDKGVCSMKKLISVFFAILMVMAVMVPAFAAYGDYSNKSYKYCLNPVEGKKFGCFKVNDADAKICRSCGGSLDKKFEGEYVTEGMAGYYWETLNGDHDIPKDAGGVYVRCPECDWVNGYDPGEKDGECQYCDAIIPNWINNAFEIEFGLVCPECNTYVARDSVDEFERCGNCGTLINEIEPTRYSGDPLDPDANWDERPVDGNKEPTFFEKLANAFANFFAKIAEFFKKIIDAIGSIFK